MMLILCVACRGVDCVFDSRCDVCNDWSEKVMRRYCKHRKSLLSKSKKSKSTSSIVFYHDVLPVFFSSSDVPVHSDFMTSFVDLLSDLASQLDVKIDKNLAEFPNSWSNNLFSFMSRLEGMLAGSSRVQSVIPELLVSTSFLFIKIVHIRMILPFTTSSCMWTTCLAKGK